jgi:hypothetical protein
MEKTYTHTIKTLDGEEKEVTLHRMTVRHGMKLTSLQGDEAIEALIDMIAPGVLDEIAPESLSGLVELITETEKGFFDQLVTSMPASTPKTKKSKKSK